MLNVDKYFVSRSEGIRQPFFADFGIDQVNRFQVCARYDLYFSSDCFSIVLFAKSYYSIKGYNAVGLF